MQSVSNASSVCCMLSSGHAGLAENGADLREQGVPVLDMCLQLALEIIQVMPVALFQALEIGSCLLQLLQLQLSRIDRKSTRLNSSHSGESRMPSSA